MKTQIGKIAYWGIPIITALTLTSMLQSAQAWTITQRSGDIEPVDPNPPTTIEYCQTQLPSYACPASLSQAQAKITTHLTRDAINLISGAAFDPTTQTKWACFVYAYESWKSQCAIWSYLPIDSVALGYRQNLLRMENPLYTDY